MTYDLKKDNRGSAIVTVIVVSAFITVIATTMLYVAARNYQTKQTDYQNKDSFYKAEEALDTLKALLAQDVSDAFWYAYSDTMTNYVDHKGFSNTENFYAESFTSRLNDVWNDRKGGGSCLDAVKKFMLDNSVDPDLVNCIKKVGGFQTPPSKDKFMITQIEVAYEPTDGSYSTYISVDIGLQLPECKIGTDKTSTSADYETIDVTECVKYMNWKRYDD